MPWFVRREEAEAFLATITRQPDRSYRVMPNGCGSGWAVAVFDAEGELITEAYGSEMELAAETAERDEKIKRMRRELEVRGIKPH